MESKKRKYIYLDNAAATPLDHHVSRAMDNCNAILFGNPNSSHSFGREALKAVDYARRVIADFLGSSNKEIIFTSGATESNNLALRGVVKAYKDAVKKPEIIVSPIEHPSVSKTCEDLKREGAIIRYLPIDKKGIVDVNSLSRFINKSTVLISVMYANNEIGTIEPIREIGKKIEKINKYRSDINKQALPILFHTDAVQAVPFLNCNVDYLHVDLLSFSGHKINGPKGIGVLFIRKNIPFLKIQTGGNQEYGFRAGTLNVPSIAGLGKAVQLSNRNKSRYYTKMRELQKWAIKKIKAAVPSVKLNGPQGNLRLPNNIHLRAKGILGEDLAFLFDQQAKIAVSTGSACNSGAAKESPVLLALGYSGQEAREGLRITFGKDTTKSDLKIFIDFYKKFVKRLRKNKS